MTILEKKSKRKATALLNLVKSGEYSISYALIQAEEMNDTGKLLDTDYEEVVEYLEGLLETPERSSDMEEIQEENGENSEEVENTSESTAEIEEDS